MSAFDPPLAPLPPLPLAGLRVLAVEDHAIGRMLLEAMLGGFGVVATLVGTGEEARRTAAVGVFDVVLIDLGLPDIPGDRLAVELAQSPGCRDAAIIAVTGRERPTQLPDVFRSWLQKPFSGRELHDHLTAAAPVHAVRRA
ncbi:response regulator [Siculibacillus lacustris]|uniref:Response regulator n=1 Tax=Siculibacillus lacustris TaxID=1549641 RepID=A0A4Q9VLV5_9HYPH|nr:response regulator [Siculibacillus lacustris]TBW36252.1 response regulator [Siculibacillus lacustris]